MKDLTAFTGLPGEMRPICPSAGRRRQQVFQVDTGN